VHPLPSRYRDWRPELPWGHRQPGLLAKLPRGRFGERFVPLETPAGRDPQRWFGIEVVHDAHQQDATLVVNDDDPSRQTLRSSHRRIVANPAT